MQPGPSTPRRVALVTAGFDIGGGIPTIARWLRDCLRSTGRYEVDVHDLATSRRDVFSRRLLAPSSWLRPSLRDRPRSEDSVAHWGANLVEIETMRYLPRRELRQTLQKYDIIQVVSGGPALAWAVTGTGVPIVLWVASIMAWERLRKIAEQTGPLGLWRRAMTRLTSHVERSAVNRADAVLVLNDALLEFMRATGHNHVVKALPGVDTTVFSPSPLGWQRHGHLLSVCRLNDPRKGIDRMIHAYSVMVGADVSIPPLILAGRGRLPESLLHLIKVLGLSSRVMVRPDVGRTELPELYRGAAVFLQTSYEEGLGMSVLEAMASGVPVIATETAGTNETIANGVTGWLVAQDSGEDIAQVVASRALDILRGNGAELGVQARNRSVNAFSNDVAIRRFVDTYDHLLARTHQVVDDVAGNQPTAES